MKPTLDLGPSPLPNRRHEDADDFAERRESTPWNIAEWASVVAKVGIPGVIAIGGTAAAFYLVYIFASTVPAKIDVHAAESRRDNARMLKVLERICINTAPDAAARERCLSWSFDEAR